jgi:hypothetical protein
MEKMILNEVEKYIYQKDEIKNGELYCGSACVAMITGNMPQDVADIIGPSASDDKLTDYLKKAGCVITKISDGGTIETDWGFIPTDKDFDIMRKCLDDGRVILWHVWGKDGKSLGHYILIVGYQEATDIFVAYDPAGNRNIGYFNYQGKGARYTESVLITAGCKRSFAIEV